jgi:pimeloyl-ACP methyl ester carboxylesterase
MQFIFYIILLFVLTGCPDNKYRPRRVNNPEDLRATGDDAYLRSALRSVMKGASLSKVARCPQIIIDIMENQRDYSCGALRVPQDHSKPSLNQQMAVGYFKYPSVFDVSKPLLVIEQGGPGASSMMLASWYLYAMPQLTTSFNILAVEQRGTEWTYPQVTCQDVIQVVERGLEQGVDSGILNERIKRTNESCFKKASQKMDLSKISTYQIAQDIVFASEQSGFNKFNYYGVSYGTVVGQYLLEFNSENIENIVLDSPVVVGQLWFEDALKNRDEFMTKRFETYLENYMPERNFDEAMAFIKSMAQKFDSKPLDLKIPIDSIPRDFRVDQDFFLEFLHSELE